MCCNDFWEFYTQLHCTMFESLPGRVRPLCIKGGRQDLASMLESPKMLGFIFSNGSERLPCTDVGEYKEEAFGAMLETEI